jgi:hypothetical protein
MPFSERGLAFLVQRQVAGQDRVIQQERQPVLANPGSRWYSPCSVPSADPAKKREMRSRPR